MNRLISERAPMILESLISRFKFANLLSFIAGWARCLRYMSPLDAFLVERGGIMRRRLIPIKIRDIGMVYIRSGTSDSVVLKQIFVHKEYDIASLKQFANIIDLYKEMVFRNERPLIIDCGANIGLSIVFFASMFPDAEIIGIEPASDNVEVAKKNVGCRKHVQIIEAAVHSKEETLTLKTNNTSQWAYTTEVPTMETAADQKVKGITMGALTQGRKSQNILIAKIDIEGAESALFSGDLSWMEKTSLIIIELHDWLFPGKGTSHSFFRALEGRKFELLQRGENLFLFLDNSYSSE